MRHLDQCPVQVYTQTRDRGIGRVGAEAEGCVVSKTHTPTDTLPIGGGMCLRTNPVAEREENP